MTDNETPNRQPSGPEGELPPGQVSEGDLDDVLANASALAEDLSEQVGASSGHVAAEPATSSADDATLPSDIDAELMELERLVASAGQELDDANEPGDERAPLIDEPDVTSEAGAPSDAGAASPDTTSIPDFMAEFTRSEGEVDRSAGAPGTANGQSAHSPVIAPRPGVVGTGMVGAAGDMGASSKADAGSEAGLTSGLMSKLMMRARRVVERVGLPALRWGEKAVALLEVIDRPFGRLGNSVRRVIGWVALATAGTSVLVFLYSLI